VVAVNRLLAIALGGAFGAVARYTISGWVARLTHESPFPYGTLAVNLIGSFLLGLLMGLGGEGRLMLPPSVRIVVGIGFLGAFTTFSTFSYETVEAFRVGDVRVAIGNTVVSVLFALAACWLGLELGTRA
jgi:fluoride exporter